MIVSCATTKKTFNDDGDEDEVKSSKGKILFKGMKNTNLFVTHRYRRETCEGIVV